VEVKNNLFVEALQTSFSNSQKIEYNIDAAFQLTILREFNKIEQIVKNFVEVRVKLVSNIFKIVPFFIDTEYENKKSRLYSC
jgi:hypothetical protein